MTHVDNIIKTNNDYSSFAKAIEEGPHAAVHSIIGGDEKLGHMSSWRSPLDPIFWLHHAFIDKLFYTWQQRGKSPRFDGREYGYKGVDETHIIKPFRVPAKLILDLENTCTNYQDIPQNLLDRIQTKHFDSIRAPKAPKNWMNGSDVDAAKKLLDEAANLTETVNEMIKNKTLDPDKVINVDDFLGENMKPTVKDKKKRNGECTTVIYSYVSAFLMAIAMLSMSVV